MAEKEELEITIFPDGEIKVFIKGIKGKRCLKYVDAFKNSIGEIKEQRLTSEYYEPEPKVGISVSKK